MATAKQLSKKLLKSNLFKADDIKSEQPWEVEIVFENSSITTRRDEVEVYVVDEDDDIDYDKTDELKDRVHELLGWGGFRCIYGGWVLQANYQSPGDWNDKSSQWHY